MKNTLVTLLIVVVLAVGGFGAYTLYKKANQKADDASTTSTSQQALAEHADDGNGSSANAVATSSVEIKDFAYSPSNITVKKGTTVTWTNKDSVAHTVTSDDNDKNTDKLDSKLLQKGESFKATFNTTGTYRYHCAPHPNMTASVTVTD